MPEKYELLDIDNKTIKSEQNKYITEIMNLSDEMKITIFPFFYVFNYFKKIKNHLVTITNLIKKGYTVENLIEFPGH